MTGRSDDIILCGITLFTIKKLREVLIEYTAKILRPIESNENINGSTLLQSHIASLKKIWCRLYEINNYTHAISFTKDLAPRTEKLFCSIEHYERSELMNKLTELSQRIVQDSPIFESISFSEYLHLVELIGELIDPIPGVVGRVKVRINQVRPTLKS